MNTPQLPNKDIENNKETNNIKKKQLKEEANSTKMQEIDPSMMFVIFCVISEIVIVTCISTLTNLHTRDITFIAIGGWVGLAVVCAPVCVLSGFICKYGVKKFTVKETKAPTIPPFSHVLKSNRKDDDESTIDTCSTTSSTF
jgi:hypothetical protein